MSKGKKTEDKLVEELVAEVEKASESSIGEVVDGGETPMVVSQEIGRDKVFIWDNRTGQRSVCLKYLLPKVLEKKRADGTRVFTTSDPKIPQKAGTYLCILHPDDPNREIWDSMGLGVCKKSNLISEYHRDRHVQKKHKDEWNVIKDYRAKQKEAEQRDFQRSLLAKATGAG